MSNINELNQKIAILNADSQRVNNERAVNIGKHDTLSKQLDAAIKSYNEKYGKNITVETLEQEINAVTTAKEKEIADIEAVLNAIKSGDYAKANELSNGVSEASEPTQVEPTQVVTPAVTEPAKVEPAQTVVTPAQVVTPPVISEPIAPPVVEPMVSEPIAPPIVEPIAPPMVEPAQVTPPPVVTPPPMVEPVTPPPIMTPPPVVTPPPVTTEAPKSFSAILGGTAFGQ